MWILSERAQSMNPSVLREILKVTQQPEVISFAGGLPSASTFPMQAIQEAAYDCLAEDQKSVLQYSESEGYLPLREWIANSLPWSVDASQVLITTGSQQALDIVGKVLIDTGSKILIESPTYLGALQAFAPMQPEFVSINSSNQGLGLDLEQLRQHAQDARFLYLLPNYQNPTGRTLSLEHRQALIETAIECNLPIIEDNPYGELWYNAPPPASVTSLAPEQCIYHGSFSKILAPGLRLGYVVAPKAVYPKLLQAKQASDLHTPTLNQHIVYRVIKDGFLDHHVPKIRQLYKQQRDALHTALETHLAPLGVSWNQPDGGMFLWAQLPEGLDATELLYKAIKKEVAFVPGAPFYASKPDPRSFRLSYVTTSVEQIETGAARLARIISDALKSR